MTTDAWQHAYRIGERVYWRGNRNDPGYVTDMDGPRVKVKWVHDGYDMWMDREDVVILD